MGTPSQYPQAPVLQAKPGKGRKQARDGDGTGPSCKSLFGLGLARRTCSRLGLLRPLGLILLSSLSHCILFSSHTVL